MGAQLVNYYEMVAAEFGFEGRMKLALLTTISSSKAGAEPDTPANIQKFEDALTQIRQGSKS
jgi:hypothetical protein